MSVHKPEPPIVIKKKVVSHGGHHGGAWKVAYADFVTAMMSLFIVLWLMNANEQVKQAVSSYFRDPAGEGKDIAVAKGKTSGSVKVGTADMQNLKEKIAAAMKQVPQLAKLKEHVEMTITPEGLRVELLENDGGMFFANAEAEPSPVGVEMLSMLAAELGKLSNSILIEGHTDSRPYSGKRSYSNWELSADRANAARRLMDQKGLRTGQITEVRGCADQRPRKPKEPEHVSNRRVSLIVQNSDLAQPRAAAQSGPPSAAH